MYATARQGTGHLRILKLPMDGSRGTLLPESIQNIKAYSPDGKQLLCLDTEGHPSIASDTGETPRTLAWTLAPGEGIVEWIAPNEVLVSHPEDALHLRLDRVELDTGRRTLSQRLAPPDPAGVTRLYNVRVSGDGKTVGFTYTRIPVSDLLVAEGLK